jgi:hypothetical protein
MLISFGVPPWSMLEKESASLPQGPPPRAVWGVPPCFCEGLVKPLTVTKINL